jgi:hypothetical protein
MTQTARWWKASWLLNSDEIGPLLAGGTIDPPEQQFDSLKFHEDLFHLLHRDLGTVVAVAGELLFRP